MARIHNINSKIKDGIAVDELRTIIARVEGIDERIVRDQSDKKAVFAEARGKGFDVKTIRKIIAIRKQSQDEREQEQAVLDTYMRALGMQLTLDLEENDDQDDKKDD